MSTLAQVSQDQWTRHVITQPALGVHTKFATTNEYGGPQGPGALGLFHPHFKSFKGVSSILFMLQTKHKCAGKSISHILAESKRFLLEVIQIDSLIT